MARRKIFATRRGAALRLRADGLRRRRRARARRLVLTHISDETDLARARRDAEAAFGRRVEIAAEGATYEV
jgi:ribonuclease BN (tRNA processing enzyme)